MINTKLIYVFTLTWTYVLTGGSIAAQEESVIPVPTQSQLAWQQAEMGVLFSYDLHVFDGGNYIQRENRIIPIPDHNIFNPTQLDTDQWIKAARDAGRCISNLQVIIQPEICRTNGNT